LTDPRASEASTVRQVVFLTDGEIGNEQQLFDAIGAMRGRSRLFMVGIGSAPNTFLMARASELGRGSYTHIGSVEQVEERMKALFGKLESPAVTNLTATFSSAGADVSPVVLPDLYRGEPVALTARVGTLAGTLDVKGTIGDRPWIVTLPLGGAAEGKGLSQLWARRKITDVEVAKTLGKLTPSEADARILALALDHHLVTRLSSLVAIDKTPSRPEGAHLSRAELPLNLPAGWEFDKVFGGEHAPVPTTRRADAGAPRDAQLAYASVVTVARAPQPAALHVAGAAPQAGVALPRTATDAELRILLGLILCALGFIVGVIRLMFGRYRMSAPGLAR
ncbi:MAG: marine proteobacterial sortase target protein, partial [Xanthobacteraceae bacterium]